MVFTPIDRKTWKRENTYEHFVKNVPCTFSMNVNIDITHFLLELKSHDLKLFPSFLYALSSIVNRHEEFRMAYDKNGNLGYYDISHPSYAVFHEETECFSTLSTEYDENFHAFYEKSQEDTGECRKNGYPSPCEMENIFHVSCIPWVNFTGFNLNLQKGYEYLSPIFTIGKFSQDRDKILLPLALQVNHAVCDAFHAARFINELQEWVENFSHDNSY